MSENFSWHEFPRTSMHPGHGETFSGGNCGCDDCAADPRLQRRLREAMYGWTPLQLAMEHFHSLCCEREICHKALRKSLRESMDTWTCLVNGISFGGHYPEPPNRLVTFHAPGFLASTPIVGIVSRIVAVGAKVTPAVV
ncbi:hypothetical protein M427DRAFT_65824, partial [Gonapodya prolifera JEL478]